MKDTFTDDSVVTEMQDFLVVNIDVESEAGAPVAKRFGVGPLPTLMFLSPDGSVRDVLLGYRKPKDFKSEVQRIRQDRGTISDLKRQVDGAPKDVDKRVAYARKLKEAGDSKGFGQQVDEIAKLDPERKNKQTGELIFERVMGQVEELWGAQRFAEIPPIIEKHLATEKDPELLFRGWATLGNIESELARQARGERDTEAADKHAEAALKANMQAFKTVPEKQLLRFGNELLWTLYERRDELGEAEKAFALESARRLHGVAETQKDVNALDTVACVYHWNGKKAEAIAVVKKALELEPDRKELEDRLKEFGG